MPKNLEELMSKIELEKEILSYMKIQLLKI